MFLTADDKNVTYDKILKEVLEDNDDEGEKLMELIFVQF